MLAWATMFTLFAGSVELITVDKGEWETMNTPTYLHKQHLIARGWNENAIRKFLGDPFVEKQNPKTGTMVGFWKTDQVIAKESSAEWSKWKKRSELMELIERSHVTVNRMELDAVKFAAVNDYNHLHVGEERFRFATVNSEPEFLNRVIVNYLRHQQTNYDTTLKVIARKVGKEQAYALLKNKVLTAIARTYHSLQDECVRQRVSIQDVLSKLN